MYFIEQIIHQFQATFALYFEGPGIPGWTPEAATERAIKEETLSQPAELEGRATRVVAETGAKEADAESRVARLQEVQGPISPAELATAQTELGEGASREAIEGQVAEARLIENISERYNISPELISGIREAGIAGSDTWSSEQTQEKLEDMVIELQSMLPEGAEFPKTIEEIQALYEANIQNDDVPVTPIDPAAAAAQGIDAQRNPEGGFQINPETPGYSQVGDTVVGPPGAPYSQGGQVYAGQPNQTASTEVNANLDASYRGLQPNISKPLSDEHKELLKNKENEKIIEKKVPQEWHGSAIKMANKIGTIQEGKVIALASMTEKRAVVCYPDGRVDEFPIVIGSGGYREGIHSGGATTPTYEVFNFNGGKVAGRGMDASQGGSSTVIGAAAYSPEGQAAGGKWWHGVADNRIPGGATLGCIGGKQENMMMMTQAILTAGGGYGFHTNSKNG